MVSESFRPETISAVIADAARDAIAEAERNNTAALGGAVPYRTFVDGIESPISTACAPMARSVRHSI
jgi:hypothetical protein